MNRAGRRALIKRSIASLRAHALRSALSLLGILFGVASVTAVSSVTEGARREAVSQLGDLGADTLVVRPRATERGRRVEITVDDAIRLPRVVPGVRAVAPIRASSTELSGPSGGVPVTVIGTDQNYAAVSRCRAAAGRLLAPLDVSEGKRVVILGAHVANAVFPRGGGIGELIRIGSDAFEVAGVLEPRASRRARGSGAPALGRDLNLSVLIPWNTAPAMSVSRLAIDEAILRLDPDVRVQPIAAAVRRAVEGSSARDSIEVVVPLEVLRQTQRTQNVFAVVTGVTSLICLIVGGVGIMNILLASVSERVREIGIRRAVGATREEIAAQFLTEGALLSATGGVFGLIAGIAAALLIARFTHWAVAAAPGLALLGFLGSVLTGLVAGAYPAWKAAHLEVMDALRRP